MSVTTETRLEPGRPFTAPEDFNTERLCARMLERHRDTVRVRKDHVAVKKLAVIVEAVLALANRQGFHATSLRDLSKRSRISMGGLYSYFDSKATLLTMILTQVTETAIEVLENPPQGVADTPRGHLDWLIDTHIRLTEAMQPWFIFAFMEAKSFPLSARRMAIDSEAATEKIFVDVLKKGVEQKCFVVDNPGITAALIKPLLQDWYVKRGKYRKRNVTIEDYIKAVSKFVGAAVFAEKTG
ncbi:MAG: TetR/AcrR family transcriptional regulator [Roseiarcus sp.]